MTGRIKQALKNYVRLGPLITLAQLCLAHMTNIRCRMFCWHLVIRPFFSWVPHKFTTKTQFGAIMSGNTKDLIQRYIYYFGLWEPNLTYFLSRRLEAGDVFVDVGSNIGYFTLLASRFVGQNGKVIAIEASPRIFAKLKEHLSRNNITNVRAVNVAVSDQPGSLALFSGPPDNIGRASILNDFEGMQECEIAALPLHQILLNGEAKRTRIIKIDVEGAEWMVVKGMVDHFGDYHDNVEIIIEISPDKLKRQGKTPEDIFAIFKRAGFNAFSLENDYSPKQYITCGQYSNPRRFTGLVMTDMDLVFSKRDTDML